MKGWGDQHLAQHAQRLTNKAAGRMYHERRAAKRYRNRMAAIGEAEGPGALERRPARTHRGKLDRFRRYAEARGDVRAVARFDALLQSKPFELRAWQSYVPRLRRGLAPLSPTSTEGMSKKDRAALMALGDVYVVKGAVGPQSMDRSVLLTRANSDLLNPGPLGTEDPAGSEVYRCMMLVHPVYQALALPSHYWEDLDQAVASVLYSLVLNGEDDYAWHIANLLARCVGGTTHVPSFEEIRAALLRAGIHPNPGPPSGAPAAAADAEWTGDEIARIAEASGADLKAVREAICGAGPEPVVLKCHGTGRAKTRAPMPNPELPSESLLARRETCAKEKKAQSIDDGFTGILARQLAVEAQQAAGVDDAQRELKAAKRYERAQVKERRMAASIRQSVSEIFPLWFDSLPDPNATLASVARVGHSEGCLYPWPVLHTIVCAEPIGVEPINPPDPPAVDGAEPVIGVTATTPLSDDTARPPGVYHEVVVRARLIRRTCEEHLSEQERIVRIPWEQWRMYSESRRTASPAFHDILRAAILYRASHSGVLHSDAEAQASSSVNDQVFAAMTAIQYAECKGLFASNLEALAQLSGAALEKEVFRRIRAADPDAPVAPGLYVEGYPINFQDVWPTQWADALKKVRGGTDPAAAAREAVQEISGSSLIRSGLRGLVRQARMLPVHIKDLVCSIPSWDTTSVALGLLKRVGTRVKAPTANLQEVRDYEEAISLAFADYGRAFSGEPISSDEVREGCEEHLRTASNLSPEDKAEFRAGVEEGLSCIESGSEVAKQFGETVALDMSKINMFPKDETMTPAKLKTGRGIACPRIRTRAHLFAIYYGCVKRLFKTMKGHTVKGLTPEGITMELMDVAGPVAGALTFATFDVSSFEGEIDAARRRLERNVLSAFCGNSPFRVAVEAHTGLLAGLGITLVNRLWTLQRDGTIRLSGEYCTSPGNFICNTCMQFGSMARACGIPLQSVGDWFRAWDKPWYIEGDDSWFAIPKDLLERLKAAQEQTGAKFEQITGPEWEDAGFLSRRLVWLRGQEKGFMTDPVEALGRLTSDVGPDRATLKRDWDLLMARSISYAIIYAEMPYVGPLARAVIRSNLRAAGEIVCDAAQEVPATKAGRWLNEHFVRPHGEFSAARQEMLLDRFGRCLETTIKEDAIAWCSTLHPEINAAGHAAFEKACEKIAYGKNAVLECPEMQAIAARMPALKATVTRVVADAREEARKVSDLLNRTRVAAQATGAGVLAALMFWATVAWSLVALGLSALICVSTWWGLLAGVGLFVVTAAGVTGVMIFVMWVLMGYSWAATRRTYGWLWTLYFACVCYRALMVASPLARRMIAAPAQVDAAAQGPAPTLRPKSWMLRLAARAWLF